MEVGIGLPNTVPGTTGEQLVEFARRADGTGLSTLGTIDRLRYDNFEPLAALAAAAAVTERIGLATTVLLGPLHRNPALLSKQLMTLNALSDGRFTLGIGLGARDDDFEVSGIDPAGKGRQLDGLLEAMSDAHANEDIGPRREGAGPPRIIVGGHAPQSFARAARFGEGWIAGGATPEQFEEMAAGVGQAWKEAGREDKPHLMALGYFSLGGDAEANAQSYLNDYYAFLGEEISEVIAGSAAMDADAVRGYLAAFEAAGCDEFIFFPCSSGPEQVDLLAAAADFAGTA